MTVTRRRLLGALAAGVAGGSAAAAARPGVRAPNILLIVLDDVGFADLGCYGSELRTPAIDGLAARGVRFANFHAAPLCSPTRAALLTGRDPHLVGVGTIADWADARPGYRGVVRADAPMLPELLRARGYGCYAVGKWHLTAVRDEDAGGPFDQWPTSRGFDRWYGFQGATADQWHPELFEDRRPVDPDRGPGRHLTADLADRMGDHIAAHVATTPDRPFFGYLALGACHWPLQVPAAHAARLRGRYDAGWSRLRAERLRRQQRIGLMPSDLRLPPENPDVPAWDALPEDDRRFAARCMEVYGGFLEHADARIGLLLDRIGRLGALDDTLVVLLSDNGATAEGGPLGAADFRRTLYGPPETAAERARVLETLGDARGFPAYPLGWAAAGNTPLKWYKSTAHEGGVRTPLILCWPNGRFTPGHAGGIRHQFHHVSDVAPTIFDMLDLPTRGFGGTSFAYAMTDAAAPTRKKRQLFEATGSRALWEAGWKAVARHVKGTDFAADRWELYHSDADPAEQHDLAASEPARLASMVARWDALAHAGQVLPLGDARAERYAANAPRRPTRLLLAPGLPRIGRLFMPDVRRAHRIDALIEIDRSSRGVILAAGGPLRGYELFLADGRLTYAYRQDRDTVVRLRSRRLRPGAATVTVELDDGAGRPRGARILVDGEPHAAARIDRSWPIAAAGAGLRCGANGGGPVSGDYRGRFPFTGKLRRVDIVVG